MLLNSQPPTRWTFTMPSFKLSVSKSKISLRKIQKMNLVFALFSPIFWYSWHLALIFLFSISLFHPFVYIKRIFLVYHNFFNNFSSFFWGGEPIPSTRYLWWWQDWHVSLGVTSYRSRLLCEPFPRCSPSRDTPYKSMIMVLGLQLFFLCQLRDTSSEWEIWEGKKKVNLPSYGWFLTRSLTLPVELTLKEQWHVSFTKGRFHSSL